MGRLARLRTLAALLPALLPAAGCAVAIAALTPAPPAAAGELGPVVGAVQEWANRVRRENGAPVLRRDEALEKVAAEYSRELAARGELAHESPTPGRATPAERLAAGGARFGRWAENLAWATEGRDNVGWRVVNGWMFSPGHRAHLLDPGFHYVGTGVAQGRDGSWYVVQLYAAQPLHQRRRASRGGLDASR
ncbi:MAG TPA: CAP domain-containing protein [Longimicrobium sp.]|jgi:uncharacterized protein YkwD